MTFRGEVGTVPRIYEEDAEKLLEWRIPGFPSLSKGDGDRYVSPCFEARCATWRLKLYPNGLTQLASAGTCDLFLFRMDGGGAGRTFTVTAAVRGPKGVENRRKLTQEFSSESNVCSWLGFWSRSKMSERLVERDVLIITLLVHEESTQTTDEDKEDKVPTEEKQSSEKNGIEKMAEDIGKLLSSGEMSDVTVQVGDVDFRVHSVILSARCPALSVSLQHDSKEKETRRIVVEDCRPEVFRNFLQFLYTGSIESLAEQNVFDLHRVADRYLADDLKKLCLVHVQDNMSVQTFCDAVRLALTHGQRGLLEQATDFASENIRFIIRSVEWQHFMRDCPTEANEILIKSLGPPS